MVRKGPPVRIRQRALETALPRGLLDFGAARATSRRSGRGQRFLTTYAWHCIAGWSGADRRPCQIVGFDHPGTQWVPSCRRPLLRPWRPVRIDRHWRSLGHDEHAFGGAERIRLGVGRPQVQTLSPRFKESPGNPGLSSFWPRAPAGRRGTNGDQFPPQLPMAAHETLPWVGPPLRQLGYLLRALANA
jgi:hypothetical protein